MKRRLFSGIVVLVLGGLVLVWPSSVLAITLFPRVTFTLPSPTPTPTVKIKYVPPIFELFVASPTPTATPTATATPTESIATATPIVAAASPAVVSPTTPPAAVQPTNAGALPTPPLIPTTNLWQLATFLLVAALVGAGLVFLLLNRKKETKEKKK